jgi:hypothetical protein
MKVLQTDKNYPLLHNFRRKESLFIFNTETVVNIFSAEGGHTRDDWSVAKHLFAFIPPL